MRSHASAGWLARARKQVNTNSYDDLLHRREQMLQQHKVRVAMRREAAASYVQSHYRGMRMREHLRSQVRAIVRIQRCVQHMRTRRKWRVLLHDVMNYSMMVGRREKILRRSKMKRQAAATPEREAAAIHLQRAER